jgi:hypothetical protein
MTGRMPYHVMESGNYVSGGMNMLPAKLKQVGYAAHQVGKCAQPALCALPQPAPDSATQPQSLRVRCGRAPWLADAMDDTSGARLRLVVRFPGRSRRPLCTHDRRLALDIQVILIPPCIFHWRFSIQNIQGGVRMTLAPTGGSLFGCAPSHRAVDLFRNNATAAEWCVDHVGDRHCNGKQPGRITPGVPGVPWDPLAPPSVPRRRHPRTHRKPSGYPA